MSDAPQSTAVPQYDPNSPNGLSPQPDQSAQAAQPTPVPVEAQPVTAAPTVASAAQTPPLMTGSFSDRLGAALQDSIQTPAGAVLASQPSGFMKMILASAADALAPVKPAPQPSNAERIINGVENFFAPMAQFKNAPISGLGVVAAQDQAQREAQRKQQMEEQQMQSREQREKLQFALNVAQSNANMIHSQYLLHSMARAEMDANIADSQKALETFKNQPNPGQIIAQDVDSDEVKRLLQLHSTDPTKGFNPSTMTAYLTGKKEIGFDENGLPQYRGTYTIATLPPQVRITSAEEAKSLFPTLQGLDKVDAEHPLVVDGALYNSAFQRRETVQAATAAAQKAADEAAIATKERADKIEAMRFAGSEFFAQDMAQLARQHPDWSHAEVVIGAYRLLQANPPLDANGNKRFPNLEQDIATRLGEKNFNNIETAAETARHNRNEEYIKRQQQLAPNGGPQGTIPISAGMQQKIDELRQVNPTGTAILDRFDNLTKAALMSVAFGDGSVDFDQAFPARLTKGAPGIARQTALGVIRQINPAWNEQQYRALQNAYKDISTGKNSQAIQQYNNFMQHSANLLDVIQNATTARGPRVWNMALNKFEDAGYGEDASRIRAAIEPVKNEFALLMSQGYKPGEEEMKSYNTLLNPAATPGQIGAALKVLGEVGAVRLDNINQNYRRVSGKNIPGLVSQRTKDAARHLALSPTAQGTINSFDSGNTIFGDQTITGANRPQQQPTPNTHVFDPGAWQQSHPGQDVNAAIAYAKSQGYTVKQ